MGKARAWMLGLAAVMFVAQLVDVVLPQRDSHSGTPAGAVFAVALFFTLALYPNGRFVPRWTVVAALLASGLYLTSYLIGPVVAARWLWPLPIAPILLALVVGGQGYRYWRRATAVEREAVRWPLLGLLLLLTLVLPVDLVSIALTGSPIADPNPFLTAIVQLSFFLPTLGFFAGLLAPGTELVDRLLAGWVAVVSGAVALGLVFAGAFSLVGLWLIQPWSGVVSAALMVVASIWLVPLARRLGQVVVFRGRAETQKALTALTRRLGTTLDAAEVPTHVAETVREATGARAVVIRRSGQLGIWARAGEPLAEGDPASWETAIDYLGLRVASLSVWPRPGEASLTTADLRLVDALATASAPALHGARLAVAFPELTDRERQVLAGITRGLPNSAIAARLGVSTKTVANYVSIVLTKLRVPDKERAAELARRRAAEVG
jgi:DNA-binding CsgD family transcriptional regulator